jgi:4-carboxymuconolactone decarboxylase
MARIKGVEPGDAGLGTRFLYWLVQRKMGQLTGKSSVGEPIKIVAHHPRLLRALGQMEMGQAAARTVSAALKSLASIKAATLVGCPF